MRELQAQLKKLKSMKKHAAAINPDRSWVASTRAQLFQKIQHDVPESRSSFFEKVVPLVSLFGTPRLYLLGKTALAVLLVFGLTVSGWVAGVNASYNSLPGDFLYNVKLATEKTQVAVAQATGNSSAAIQLEFDFAERRVKEIEKVTTEPHRVATATKQLEKSVVSAQDTLQTVQQKNPERAAQLAKDITDRTTELAADLRQVTNQAAAVGTQTSLVEIKKVVADANVDAISILSAKDPEQAKGLVAQKVEEILRDANTVKAAVEEVNLAVNASTTPAVSSTISVSVSSSIPVSSTTPPTTSSTSSVTPPATTGAELTKTVEQVVKQVQQLIEGNKVTEAVEQLKLLNTITSANEQALVDVQGQVKGTTSVSSSTVGTPLLSTKTETSSPKKAETK